MLVPGEFEIAVDPNGDTVIYPEGDRDAPPSGRMPKGFHFFDTIVRQEPIDEATGCGSRTTWRSSSRSRTRTSRRSGTTWTRRARRAAP